MTDDKTTQLPAASPAQSPATSPSSGDAVQVINPHGEVYSIPKATAAETLKNDTEGFKLASPADIAAADAKKKYGGVAGAAGAAGLGAARGLTFGLSDPALAAVGGDDYRKYANAVREANPNIDMAAEGAGALAGALATDGAGLAARAGRAATLIPRGASALGHLAGSAAEHVVGAGAESFLGRGLQAAARVGAQEATVGALMSVGKQISEDTLGDHQLHAENLLASAGSGLLTGGALGGAMGFAGGLASRAFQNLGRLVPSAESLEESAQENAARGLGLKMHHYKTLGLRDVVDEAGNVIAKGGTAEARTAEASQLGKVALDQGVIDGTVSNHLEMAERNTRIQEQIGKTLDQQRSEINQLGKFDVNDLRGKIRSEIYDPLMSNSSPEFRAIAKDVQDRFNGAFGYSGTSTFDAAHKFRRELDDILNARGSFDKETGLRDKYLQQMRGALESEYESQADKLAGMHDPELLKNYKSTKWLYGKLATINDIVKDESARDWSNQRRGIKDWITGGTMASIGTHIGSMVGGPLGAAAGGTLGGVAGSEANAFIRERGANMAAEMYRKAATFSAMNDLNQAISNTVDRGVNAFVNGGARAANVASNVSRDVSGRQKPMSVKTYLQTADQIRQLASNPSEVRRRATQLVPPSVAEHAPSVGVAMGDAAVRKYQFLASKLPMSPTPMNTMQPFLSTRAPSHEQMTKFGRYLVGADHPFQVLDMAAKGTLNRDVLESFSAIYPSLYGNLLKQMTAAVGRKRKGMKMAQMNALGIIFKAAVTPMQQREWVEMAQSSYDPKFSSGGDGGTIANGTSDGGDQQPGQSPLQSPLADASHGQGGVAELGDKPARPIDVADAFKTTSQGLEGKLT